MPAPYSRVIPARTKLKKARLGITQATAVSEELTVCEFARRGVLPPCVVVYTHQAVNGIIRVLDRCAAVSPRQQVAVSVVSELRAINGRSHQSVVVVVHVLLCSGRRLGRSPQAIACTIITALHACVCLAD